MTWSRKIYELFSSTQNGSAGEMVALTFLEQAILDKKAYSAEAKFLIPAGGSIYVAGVTPVGPTRVYMYARTLEAKNVENQPLNFDFRLFNNCVITGQGAEVLVVNGDHNEPYNTSLFKIYKDPVVQDEGVEIKHEYYLRDRQNSIEKGDQLNKYKMAEDTTALIRVDNNSVISDLNMHIFWVWVEK